MHAAALSLWDRVRRGLAAGATVDEARLLEEERQRGNLARVPPVLWVMLVVHVVHALLFALRVLDGEGGAPSRLRWERQIFATHVTFAVFAVAGLALAPRAKRALAAGRALPFPELVAVLYVGFGAVLAMFDQAVTTAVTPYIAVVISAAVAVRLTPVATIALQGAGFAAFVLGQDLGQADPAVRLSNVVNGASLAAFAAALGVVLTNLERRAVLQQRLIVQQKQELEEALTRVRDLADRAEEANRAKGAFLGSMSHEVRTPLNAILGLASLLEDEVTDAQHRAWLETVQQSGHTLLRLLDDLLVMSRLEAERVELRPGPCDPAALVRQVAAAFEPSVREKKLALDVEVAPGVPAQVTADDVRLRQVAFNLVGNAVKFTARGRVVVRLRADAPTVGPASLVLEVEDTGRGIGADERERIFHPFVQGRRDKTETKPDGTGLGLAISQRLVELMGGTIALDSELGRGSCFTVRLPVLGG